MGTTSTATGNVEASESLDFDAIVIGAGVSGLYQLYKLRELELRVRVFEAGSTWHWNRYPGARFDSESDTYGYSFSQELLDEWDWSERFAAQPKTERYLNYVADKFDLRCDIQFNSRVVAAQYRDETRRWELTLEDGVRLNNVWRDSPQTYLGVLVEGFPNMLMVMGPHAGLGNFTRTAEYSVEWVTGFDPVRDRARSEADRGHGRRRRRMDRPRAGARSGSADERDRPVDDGRQSQSPGQAKTPDHALQRRAPGLPRAL